MSVITVCFNAAAVLPRTIDSLQAQRWPRREWVVVDGGSRDGTQALVLGASSPPDVYVSEPDRGIYDAMNKGVKMSRGDILYFLNADDALYDADVLGDVAARFAAEPGLHMLLGRLVVEKPGRNVLHSQHYINGLTLPYTNPCHQAVFVRRGLFDAVGLFDPRWPTSADYDWFLRVRRAGYRIEFFDRTMAYFKAGGAHARDPAALSAERRAIRLQYVSPAALAVGTFASRVLHRLSRTLRGGMGVGETRFSSP